MLWFPEVNLLKGRCVEALRHLDRSVGLLAQFRDWRVAIALRTPVDLRGSSAVDVFAQPLQVTLIELLVADDA